jgi:hypothetical protein
VGDDVVPTLDADQRQGVGGGKAAVPYARAREDDGTTDRNARLVQATGGQRRQGTTGTVAGEVERLALCPVVECGLAQRREGRLDLAREAAMHAVAAQIDHLVVEVGGPAAQRRLEVAARLRPGFRAAEDEVGRLLVRDDEAAKGGGHEGFGPGTRQRRHEVGWIGCVGRLGEAGELPGKREVHGHAFLYRQPFAPAKRLAGSRACR